MRGFTYLGLLIAIAIMSVTLAATGIVWHAANQREREKELLFIGMEFRRAIAAYYDAGPARDFPRRLEDMVRDPRYPDVRRYLRKVYVDPMTGGEWGLLRRPDGRIFGVYSQSERVPIKRAHFDPAPSSFKEAKTYADWKFAAGERPASAGAVGAAGVSPADATAGSGGPVAAVPPKKPALISPTGVDCGALAAADRAACESLYVQPDGGQPWFVCHASSPVRIAACMQDRPIPQLAKP
jgi:type II secretory pathway pseudopilin PulG